MRLQVIKLQFFEFQTNKEGNFLMKNQVNISNLRLNRVPYFYIFFFILGKNRLQISFCENKRKREDNGKTSLFQEKKKSLKNHWKKRRQYKIEMES